MSDIEGENLKLFKISVKTIWLFKQNTWHGKSSGVFTKGNISAWSNDATSVIKKIVKRNNFILIGSSMGAWIALNQFNHFKFKLKD